MTLTFPKWLNGNLATVLSLNCHAAVQTQTQTEPEAYRMHLPVLREFKISAWSNSVLKSSARCLLIYVLIANC